MSSDIKKVLIALPILLVAGYFVYATFFATPTAPETTVTDTASNGILGQDILIMAEKLRGISIDKSVFSGVLLTHLQDFSSTIVPEPQGRSNPFTPLLSGKPK